MNWRPISEVPASVDEILAFCPDNFYRDAKGRIYDDRVCLVYRVDKGWRFDHHQGGYEVEPSMFCLIELPEGAPADPRCS